MSLHDLIQAEAERLGFSLSGVAPIAPPPHLQVYERWLDSGLHAGMDYLATERARERRSHPHQILPEASALLVVAMRYFNPLAAPDGPAGEALGRVAAYAWGDDYHDIIPPRLAELVALIEQYLGRPVSARSYTDTGPILERDYAQQAGLGWSGKNTCLIHPQRGSYYLLGETLIDAPLEPSRPITTDHCGTCRRCIEACPTGCIREDRTIDSGRCISYLTIEHKGAIPTELRPQMGDWVFGCDICQMVCPWNLRFASAEGDPSTAPREGAPRSEAVRPVLRKEIHMTPQEFNRKFRRSPIQRARRRGYLRNVAVAIGNRPDPALVPDLERVLENEPEPVVRAHVAWALGRMNTLRARRALEKARRKETEESVRGEIDSALQ